MASSTEENTTRDFELTSHADAESFLAEEKRLLTSRREVRGNAVSDKRLSKFYSYVNNMTSPQLDQNLTNRQLSISGYVEIRRTRLKRHYKAELMYACDYPLRMIEQDFEYIAVVDFEATCEENNGKGYPHEIIEFPLVLINVREQKIVDQFRSYCRPVIKPILSAFCTKLTGIEQHQVDSAPVFIDVLRNVESWLRERNLLSFSNKHRLAFTTDGPWDFAVFLQKQCEFSAIPYPQWATQWINLRKMFSTFYSVRRSGIGNMLAQLGLKFNGRCHSGLDDSINIARIALELLKDGCTLSLNESLHVSNPTSSATESNDGDNVVVFEN